MSQIWLENYVLQRSFIPEWMQIIFSNLQQDLRTTIKSWIKLFLFVIYNKQSAPYFITNDF